MNMIERCFGLCSGWAVENVLWASQGQEEEVIKEGGGKLLLALYQDSHTDRKQKIAGDVSVQVESQEAREGFRGSMLAEGQGHRAAG